jgi:hypothetical protein
MTPQIVRHVKSHQHTNDTQLTKSFPARLNEKANALAKQQRHSMTIPVAKVTTPGNHLLIGDMCITRDNQWWLMETSGKIPIQKYFHNKYGWSQSTFENIDWDLQQKVLQSYDINDQKRILKFVHGWMPTNHRLHREKHSVTPRCPLCHYLCEDELHLFQCLHPMQQAVTTDMKRFMTQDSDIEQEVQTQIAEAMAESLRKTTWEPNKYHHKSIQIIRAQTKIGWQHMYFGRFTRQLTKLPSTKHVNQLGGWSCTRWPQRLLRMIWDTFIKLWHQRNEIIFGTTLKSRLEQQQKAMKARVDDCYRRKDQLTITGRNKVFTREQDEIMRENPQHIKAWIKFAERVLRLNKKENQGQTKQRNLMDKYFKWHPHEQGKKQTQKTKKQRHKQDLRPD